MSRQKAAGSRGDTALSAIKRYVGGGDCYHQFPRMSLLGFSVNRGLYLTTIRKLLQQTLLGVIIGSLERTYRGRGGSPMSSLNLVRWGAIAFMVGGVVWVLVGFLDVTTGPFIPSGSVAPVLLIVALLLLALGLVGSTPYRERATDVSGWQDSTRRLPLSRRRSWAGLSSW